MVIINTTLVLFGCEMTPETAAQEVCECINEKMQTQNPDDGISNSDDCLKVAEKYSKNFSPEKREIFIKKVGECASGYF